MANSIKKYLWDATHSTNSQFLAPTTLSGRESTDIKVKVGKTELTNSQYTLATGGASRYVKFNAGFTPNVGDSIRIYRETNHNARLVDFVDGSLLTSETLDLDSNQLFNMAQEAYDKGDETTIGSESFYYTQGDAPENVAVGTLWYDTGSSTNTLQVWSGTEWQQTAPAKVKKTYQRVTTNGFLQVANNAHSAGKTKFADTAFKTHSSLYLNGVKLVEASTLADIPSKGDYFLSGGDVILLNLSSDTDVLVSETFDGSFSSSVTASEANALDYKNQAGQSAAGASISAGQASDHRENAEDEKDDAAKYASHPKNSTFSTHDSSATGQYSAKHYAETAADSATTASSAANNSNVQRVGVDLALGNNSLIKQVADDIDDVTAVAGKLTEVDALAGKTSEMTTLTTGSTLSDINTVAGKATEVGQVAAIDSEIADVALKLSEIDAVEAKLSDIEDVAEVATKVSDVATAIPDITTVATEPYKSKIETVYTHRDTITDVGGEITKVTTVANDLTGANNIGTLADPTYKQQVTDVANQIGAVGTVSASINNNDISTVVSNVENIGTVADISDDVTNLSKSTGDMSTLVSKLGQTTDLAGAVNDAQASATAAAGSASTATTQATAAAGSASTAATHAANLGSVAYQNLTAIAESKAVTATDVFVYDTSNDSDGGAWRNRTQGTSWYNEALNTSSRGATKKFPAVAVIVLENSRLTIYDADDPSMPMWMVFSTGSNTSTGTTLYKMMVTGNLKAVTMKNGLLCVGRTSVVAVDFVADRAVYGNLTYVGDFSGHTVAQRNEYGVINNNNNWLFTGFTVQPPFNDVAITVLPNAPIDPDTGLPVPTIALGGDYGISVIKDDGSVVDITGNNWSQRSYKLSFDNKGILYFSQWAYYWMSVDVKGLTSDTSLTDGRATYSVSRDAYPFKQITCNDYGQYGADGDAATWHDGTYNLATKSGNGIATPHKLSRYNYFSRDHDNYLGDDYMLYNYTTSTYNTGWMNGDIKLATLMDTTAETISAPELVTNGDFSSFGSNLITNGEFPNDANGWDLHSDFTWDSSGRVERTSGSTNSYFSQNINIESGRTYRVRYDVVHTGGDTGSNQYSNWRGTSANHGTTLNGSGSVDVYITATRTGVLEFRLYGLGTFRGYFDNVRIEQVTGWKVTDGDPSVSIDSNGRLKMETNATDGWQAVYNYFDTEVGKTYAVTATVESASGNDGEAHFRGSAGNTVSIHNTNMFHMAIPSGSTHTFTLYFTAANVRTNVHLMTQINNTVYLDNVSVVEVVADRSVNGNGLNIVGNITKEAVATGAELVGYKGWSSHNYLEQPFNADLDFGTGDWCVMGWMKTSDNYGHIFDRMAVGVGTGRLRLDTNNGALRFRGMGSSVLIAGSGFDDNSWHHFTYLRKDGVVKIFGDGVFLDSLAHTSDYTASNAVTRIGVSVDDTGLLSGSLSLYRVSATAPTAEQIAKIYRDEKPLFQENAKATLYGTSDAVTALAYDDDTELLHAGTSAGRSVFKGLQRVSNTTDAVGTAISASNDLVVEE